MILESVSSLDLSGDSFASRIIQNQCSFSFFEIDRALCSYMLLEFTRIFAVYALNSHVSY